MIWLKRIVLTALVLYVLGLAFIYIFQRSLLYFPPKFYNPPPEWLTEVTAANGTMGWWAAPERDTAPVILVFHGNGSAIDGNMHIFRDLRAQGYGVFSVGYPGYPGNEGEHRQASIVAAAIAQYDWVAAQGISPDRIVFYGTSLGSGVAAQVAAQRDTSMLILDAPFESTLAIAKSQMRFIPVGLLMKDKYRSDLALSDLRVPLIWIHGRQDGVIPVASGQALFDGYQGPKSAHLLDGANHSNTWFSGGREIVLAALRERENQPSSPQNPAEMR